MQLLRHVDNRQSTMSIDKFVVDSLIMPSFARHDGCSAGSIPDATHRKKGKENMFFCKPKMYVVEID
jgi:hypothetical protein